MNDVKFYSLIGLIVGCMTFIGYIVKGRIQLDILILIILFARLYVSKAEEDGEKAVITFKIPRWLGGQRR